MKREIVIGGELKPNYNARCLWDWADVSENYVFYIFHLKIANNTIGIFIVKESDEGKEIAHWLSIEENRNNENVRMKAVELLLPYISVHDFFEIVDREKAESWNDGYRKAQIDIRKALGISQ